MYLYLKKLIRKFALLSYQSKKCNIMKKLSLLALSMAAVVAFTSCGGSKSASGSKFKEIEIPCSDNGRSDKEFFRASSVGNSRDLATSKEKALLLTKQRLASLISSKLKSVSERYAQEMDAGGATEFNQTFENMTRDVVNQQLVDVTIVCEKTGQKEDGSYETYMAIEVSKEAIYNGVDKGISRDKKLEVMYDREQFKKKFDEEMSKMESQY